MKRVEGFRVNFFSRDTNSMYYKQWECSVFVPVDTAEQAMPAAYEKMKDTYPETLYSAKCYPVTVTQ